MSKSHARYSPSKLEALEGCLRFEWPDAESEAAAEGQLMHKALETGDLAGLDEEQSLSVQAVLDYVAGLKAGFKQVLDLREQRVELKGLTFGTADIILIANLTEAHILDAKFGRKGATEAETNFQIETYCCATLEGNPVLERAFGYIVAPRTKDITKKEFVRADIEKCRKRIEALYERLANPFNPPTPRDDLCYICRWAKDCPALGKAVVATAKGIGLPVPDVFKPEAMVDVKDRAIGHLLASALENWAEQVKKNNTEFVKNGGSIPGFDLRERSTGFRIPRESTLTATATLKAAGVAESQIQSASVISIPELATVLAEAKGTKEANEKDALKSLLGPIAVEGRTAYLQRSKKVTDAQILLPGGDKTP